MSVHTIATPAADSQPVNGQGEEALAVKLEHSTDCDGTPCKSWCPLAPCPPWCTGQHSRPADVSEADRPRYWHMAANCPPWCSGHVSFEAEWDRDHCSVGTEVALSLLPEIEVVGSSGAENRTDYLAVRTWQDAAAGSRPYLSVMHGAGDNWSPDMTPAEAVELGAALIQAGAGAQAGDTAASPPSAASCPPWCEVADHEDWDGDDGRHHVLTWGVDLASRPFQVRGQTCHDWMNVILSQREDQNAPGIVLDPPPETRSIVLTLGEAGELAASLLVLLAKAVATSAAAETAPVDAVSAAAGSSQPAQ